MTEAMPDADAYARRTPEVPKLPAPDVPYRVLLANAYRPRIGRGSSAAAYLDAYHHAAGKLPRSAIAPGADMERRSLLFTLLTNIAVPGIFSCYWS